MAVVAKDFDRLAVLDSEGWTHNNHYHKFLLQHLHRECREALEIGCGTGALARQLAERAEHVTAIDLSPEMVRIARKHSEQFPNIDYELADVSECDFPANHFDCIATVATLHHLPLRAVLLKLKQALKPGGILLVLDLFEPERNLLTLPGVHDALLNLAAMGASMSLRLVHNGRLRPPREVRAAWEEHGRHDSYPTMKKVRALCTDLFPGARIKQHLFWRYSIVWRKSIEGTKKS
jgi:2-polyprenyl-3-methyl-5-hydroxy-6-metoxy-1,4-benzoquinol methylase